jgi:hypothetical protein
MWGSFLRIHLYLQYLRRKRRTIRREAKTAVGTKILIILKILDVCGMRWLKAIAVQITCIMAQMPKPQRIPFKRFLRYLFILSTWFILSLILQNNVAS